MQNPFSLISAAFLRPRSWCQPPLNPGQDSWLWVHCNLVLDTIVPREPQKGFYSSKSEILSQNVNSGLIMKFFLKRVFWWHSCIPGTLQNMQIVGFNLFSVKCAGEVCVVNPLPSIHLSRGKAREIHLGGLCLMMMSL